MDAEKPGRAKPEPAYLGWRGELLVKLALSRLSGITVVEQPMGGQFDYWVQTSNGSQFFIEVKCLSSIRNHIRKIGMIEHLRWRISASRLINARSTGLPVVLFLVDADTEHGRYLRIDNIRPPLKERSDITVRLPRENTITRESLGRLVDQVEDEYLRLAADVNVRVPVDTPIAARAKKQARRAHSGSTGYKTISETLVQLSGTIKDRFETIMAFLQGLGPDVQMKTLRYYVAFKRRIKNFACVDIRKREEKFLIYAKLDPSAIALEDGFIRDVTDIGHYGTGDVEITIRSMADFEKAKPLLVQAYEGS